MILKEKDMLEAKKLNDEIMNLHPVPATQNREEELSAKLAELTKEMNQFSYIVSHDLQAPLRTVTGFLELLVKRYGDKLDESAKQYIDYAVKGAAKMKDLVFDLLEYSRLNTQASAHVEVDLNDVFKETKGNLAAVIEDSRAIITADILPVVIAERKQILLLFGHLLQNALKFCTAEYPQIQILLKEEEKFWKIGIKDNGIGIDEAYHEKIFIIFRRLYADEVKYPGTGTGLAVCKRVAELHGGTIWVDSEIGNGSTFWFTLSKEPAN